MTMTTLSFSEAAALTFIAKCNLLKPQRIKLTSKLTRQGKKVAKALQQTRGRNNAVQVSK